MDSFRERAVLVKFHDRVWSGGFTNKELGRKNEEDAGGAENGTIKVWQRLVPKAALKKRYIISSTARIFHDNNTNPWLGGGIRVLPVANLQAYLKGMRKFQTEAETEDRQFVKDFTTVWIAEARKTQKKLFNASRYPSESEIACKFGFTVYVFPIPDIADWRINIDAAQLKQLKSDAERRFSEIQKDGILELYARLEEVIKTAQERLSDPKKIFRDSLIINIKDMVALIDKLNVTRDKQLADLNKEIAAKLTAVGPDSLRLDQGARSQVAKDAAAIMKKMSVYAGKPKKQS